jgi:NTE family protein
MNPPPPLDHRESAIEFLLRSALLYGVSEADLRSIEPPPEMVFLEPGETLIEQGAEDTDYFYLVSGRLHAFVEHGGRRTLAGHIWPGEGVGELSLLTGEPRSATVIARVHSQLVRFPQTTFLRLAERYPSAGLSIARTVVRRSQVQVPLGRGSHAPHRTVAVVPITPGIQGNALAQPLAQALGAFGRSECFDSSMSDDSHGDRLDNALTRILQNLEQQLDFVVYAADAAASAWSKHCVLSADLVLLVADVAAAPDLSAIEAGLIANVDQNLLGRVDLVLQHPATWRPHCGTARWLGRRRVKEHHHVRAGDAGDIARLARIVAGRANNLVLSGGGARCFAHIGALRAFAEAGVPIDRVGGTSAGSLLAGVHASGVGWSDMMRMGREFVDKRPGRDFTFPVMSLVTGRSMQQAIIDLCGDRLIEDLPIRYFCVSSDLGEAEMVTHFDGPLWSAVRASGSFPVLGPPLFLDGRVLVDGAVLNNLPVDIMREQFSGAVLAVDVSTRVPLKVDAQWNGQTPSGWRLLWNRLNPLAQSFKLPGIFDVLNRTAMLHSELQLRHTRGEADLLITPSVAAFRLGDFESIDALVQIGYTDTVSALERLSGDSQRPAGIFQGVRSADS